MCFIQKEPINIQYFEKKKIIRDVGNEIKEKPIEAFRASNGNQAISIGELGKYSNFT